MSQEGLPGLAVRLVPEELPPVHPRVPMEQVRQVPLAPKVPLTDDCKIPPRMQRPMEQGAPAVQLNPRVADPLVQTCCPPGQYLPMEPEGLLAPAVPEELKVSMIPVAGRQHLMAPEELLVLKPPLVLVVPAVPAAVALGVQPERREPAEQELPELQAVPSQVQAESRQLQAVAPMERRAACLQRLAEPVERQEAEPPELTEQAA